MKSEPARLRFGVFEADLRVGTITKLGRRISLQEQPFKVLAMLLERPGELVTRDELRSQLWPQAVVDFNHGVNKAISKIRDALGDSAENPRFIETIGGRGYRFLANVGVIGDPVEEQPATQVALVAAPAIASPAAGVQPTAPLWHGRLWWGLGIALALAAIGYGWIESTSPGSAPTMRSLAVLPFQNLSNDPTQEYFADGMTDELITRLGQISALRVISRTSAMMYKGSRKPLAQIARELNVEGVVEGSVLRVGDQVRISAQLIRVPADEGVWARSYESTIRDSLSLQNDVAEGIARQIGTTLTQQEQKALGSASPVNPEAYEAYLRGRYFWNKRTRESLAKAIEQFTLAVTTDPTYAQAYCGLADAYTLAGDWEYGVLPPQEAFDKSRAASLKALALDDTLGQAHTSLAFAYDLYGWNWDAAEKEYTSALQLNPGYATAHQWYGWHLLVMGHSREGLFELKMAQSLDPLSLIISADLADALSIAHLPDESVQQSLKTLEIDPNFALGHYTLGQAYEQKNLHQLAIGEFEKAIELGGHDNVFDSNLAYVYAVSGRRQQAQAILTNLQMRKDLNPAAQANIALIYAGLGDADQAIDWLNRAYAARFNPSILLRPAFDSLRSDTRFKALRLRIGLPGP